MTAAHRRQRAGQATMAGARIAGSSALFVVLCASLINIACAAPPAESSISIERAWARATIPGQTVGVAYFTIVNHGAPDVLLAIESTVSSRATLHSMTTVNGMMQMRLVETLPVGHDERVVLEPGGLHAMLEDLRQPLPAGSEFAITVVFRNGARVRVPVKVLGIAASAPKEPNAAH